MRPARAFTLIELLVAIIVLVIAIAGVMGMSIFCVLQVRAQMERADAQTQINFALEDMKLHFMSAISAAPMFDAAGGSASVLTVEGERDIYHITPDKTDDNEIYTYKVRSPCYTGGDEGEGCLIRKTDVSEEVLVDARFKPTIEFRYNRNDPPNFITVEIKVHTKTAPAGLNGEIARKEGVRFWFINIVEVSNP